MSHTAPSSRPITKLGWIMVLHVCEEWRSVALADPRLWTEISFALGPVWATWMFSLAKSAPLSFDARTISDKSRIILRQLLRRYLSNIRVLTIHDEAYLLQQTAEIVPVAPLLQILELRHQSSGISVSSMETLLCNVFGNSLPALRRLTLIGFSLTPACFPILSSLADLSISFPRLLETSTAPIQSFNDFLMMLANSPSLERLSLVNCLPTYDAKSPSPSSTLHLSILQSITLGGPVTDCGPLLQHVQFPPTANLLLSCTPDDNDVDQLAIKDTLFPEITARLHSDLRAPIRTLSFIPHGCTAHILKVTAWDIPGSEPETNKRTAFPPVSIFSYGTDAPATFSLTLMYSKDISFASISTLLDLRGLRTLRMAKPTEFTDTNKCKDTLVHLKQLEHISVTGPLAIAFCCTLTASKKSKDDRRNSSKTSKSARLKNKKDSTLTTEPNHARRVLLPNLTFLELREVRFADATPGSRKLFHQALPGFLTKRQTLGKPIKHLSIRECRIVGVWVHRLERVVKTVDWDYLNGCDLELDMDTEMIKGIYGDEMVEMISGLQ
ncbi:uncharacterized protein STEHIDRAFT_158939 [Stereum hirsutum FP-91666 SS1]|uniref:uncharacterized protein n=1 Tax=Stereum hirsutum (strain FP-91666) TaxID=721885 RepID=UPI0004449FF5|nr:uncharacterized protein STEHIDRAFT_158939 [Stereum hirsutum FP-91666 SS1]EIM84252.1 hypothetical protein STEHIDRAFT_158939 [Stereum hirsutum FP-91666 SS1]